MSFFVVVPSSLEASSSASSFKSIIVFIYTIIQSRKYSQQYLALAGINDIALPSMLGQQRPAADDIADGLAALAFRAEQHGIRPVVGTITPLGGSRYESFLADGNDDIRQSVNHAVRTQKDWPVADFAAALAEPGNPARLVLARVSS